MTVHAYNAEIQHSSSEEYHGRDLLNLILGNNKEQQVRQITEIILCFRVGKYF